jgi:hypothetical protein
VQPDVTAGTAGQAKLLALAAVLLPSDGRSRKLGAENVSAHDWVERSGAPYLDLAVDKLP